MAHSRASIAIVLLAGTCAAVCGRSQDEDSGPASSELASGWASRGDLPVEEGASSAALPGVVAGTAPDNSYSQEQILHGKQLTAIGGCNDCHTPWVFSETLGALVPERARLLSGHPAGVPGPRAKPGADSRMVMGATGTSFAMPFGVVYAPNLTPDMETGIGSWTEEMFVNVFRKATHMGGSGRPVLPPMPWPNIAMLSEEDLVALFAYLHSVPPIRNGVRTTNPPQEVTDGISRTNALILEEVAAP